MHRDDEYWYSNDMKHRPDGGDTNCDSHGNNSYYNANSRYNQWDERAQNEQYRELRDNSNPSYDNRNIQPNRENDFYFNRDYGNSNTWQDFNPNRNDYDNYSDHDRYDRRDAVTYNERHKSFDRFAEQTEQRFDRWANRDYCEHRADNNPSR